MFALILGAVRTRTAQVLTVLVLTALAAAVAAAGPWFAVAGATRAAAADVAAAPAAQRTLSIRQISFTDGDPQHTLDQFVATIRGLLPLPASAPVTGVVLPLTVTRGGETPAVSIAYRDGFCSHVRLDGVCPAAGSEAAISLNVAQQLGIRLGDRLVMRAGPTADPITVKITSRYEVADPTGTYWSNPLYQSSGGLDPVFTPLATFTDPQLFKPTVTYDVTVPDRLIRGDGGYDLGSLLAEADVRLGVDQLRLVNSTGRLLATIDADRSAIRTGVLVALLQTLVLTWFAIGLAGRCTGRDRRGDAALLKLRGSTRLGMLRLAWGQHLVPLVLGAIVGAPLGYLLARVMSGPVTATADRRTALLLSLAAVAAVLLGGLAVLAVVEAVVLRLPVATLLRQVSSGRGDWRAGLADLLLLAVAVAAVYQARSGDPGNGLAQAAPALVALAVALLLARLLGRVADRGGGAAVRAGRLRLGLTGVQVSRQPGSDRVFALVVVAVAMFATALGGWNGERVARTERSGAELGATRVLTVQAANRSVLEHAVRQADPRGDQAMAAVVDTTSIPPVLAVDSSRLAAVARWRPEYGPIGTLPTAVAEAPGPSPLPAITGDRLTVRARKDGGAAAALTLVLQNDATGTTAKVGFGVLADGEQTRSAPVTGCAPAPGCRILRWEMTTPPEADGRSTAAAFGTVVTVRGLTQQGPAATVPDSAATVLDSAALADIARWRPGTTGAALDIAAADGALRMAVDQNSAGYPQIGVEVWAVDTALPVPVVLAGPAEQTWQFDEPNLFSFGGSPIPVRVAGTATALPVLGTAGVLTDLDTARRIIGDTSPPGEFQVWLAPTADPGIVDALTRTGLTVLDDRSLTGHAARLAQQAPSAVARFTLLCGLIGLLLAAAALAVAGAVDRRTRLEQLRALRVQGLPRRAASVTAWSGTAALIVAALLGGVAAAALAQPLARVEVPAFTDGWAVLPAPTALDPAALAVAGTLALLVLGLTGWLSVLPLIRRLREGSR
ncbi:FtsX-like permease family protein [Micromonosporaceae bacterium Da 78-11]